MIEEFGRNFFPCQWLPYWLSPQECFLSQGFFEIAREQGKGERTLDILMEAIRESTLRQKKGVVFLNRKSFFWPKNFFRAEIHILVPRVDRPSSKFRLANLKTDFNERSDFSGNEKNAFPRAKFLRLHWE